MNGSRLSGSVSATEHPSIIAPVRTVHASVVCHVSVHEAQTAWCDTSRWRSWVDGLEQVVEVDPGWPEPGAAVRWRSNPAGRGSVSERVVAYEPLEAIVLDVEDDYMRGRQQVVFTPVGEETEVTLALSYEVRKRTIVTPAVDLLFIRRAMLTSLRTTLGRFAAMTAGQG